MVRRIAATSSYQETEVYDALLANLSASFAKSGLLKELIENQEIELKRFTKRLAYAAGLDEYFLPDDLLNAARHTDYRARNSSCQ